MAMKTLRIIFFILLTLVILVIGGAYVAIRFMDMQQIKELVQARVEAQTGRTLVIAGEVKPTIGFMPTVSMADVSLSNPDWASAPDMLRISQLRVTFELEPLLHRELRISNIEIDGAEIALEKKGEEA